MISLYDSVGLGSVELIHILLQQILKHKAPSAYLKGKTQLIED